MKKSLSENLLSAKFDHNLKFNINIEDVCKKSSRKLNVHERLTPPGFIYILVIWLISNVCFKSQFNYCPMILMYSNQTLNNKISYLHERSL